MKIDFMKKPVDNIFDLLKRDNPRLKGDIEGFNIEVNKPVSDEIKNTFKITTTKESVYIPEESSVFTFKRQNLLYTKGLSPIRLEVDEGFDIEDVKKSLLELIPNEFKSVVDVDLIADGEGGITTKITTKEEWVPYVYGEPKIYVVVNKSAPEEPGDLPGTYMEGMDLNDNGYAGSHNLYGLVEILGDM